MKNQSRNASTIAISDLIAQQIFSENSKNSELSFSDTHSRAGWKKISKMSFYLELCGYLKWHILSLRKFSKKKKTFLKHLIRSECSNSTYSEWYVSFFSPENIYWYFLYYKAKQQSNILVYILLAIKPQIVFRNKLKKKCFYLCFFPVPK